MLYFEETKVENVGMSEKPEVEGRMLSFLPLIPGCYPEQAQLPIAFWHLSYPALYISHIAQVISSELETVPVFSHLALLP